MLSGIGEDSSIPFICHHIPEVVTEKNKEGQVIVVGGTNGISARVNKGEKMTKIVSKKTFDLPSFKKAKDFFEFIVSHIAEDTDNLALNFAHAIVPKLRDGRMDGVFLMGSKEHSFTGLKNKLVGKELEKYYYSKHGKQINVYVANDTICLLLSGLDVVTWDELACGIIGTGLNIAVFLDEKMMVNLESGEFSNFTQTKEGKVVDKNSGNIGGSLFEKEVSGAWLYKHYNIWAKRNKYPLIDSTEELNNLARFDKSEKGQGAKFLLEKSAAFFAVQVIGLLEFLERDLTFIMEGSLFWKGYNYKEDVERYVMSLTPRHRALFKQVKESGIIGAAQLIT
jgi:hypothetical protein